MRKTQPSVRGQSLSSRGLFPRSQSATTQAGLWADSERAPALFPMSHLNASCHPKTNDGRGSLSEPEHQRRGHGHEYIRSAHRRRRRRGSVHLAGSPIPILNQMEGLVVENRASGSSFHFFSPSPKI